MKRRVEHRASYVAIAGGWGKSVLMDENFEKRSAASPNSDRSHLEVDGELFEVTTRTNPDGICAYDFTWTNGPNEASYGFTVGPSVPSQAGFTEAFLEREAALFVRGFFAEGGIGPSDFPDFVASRRNKRG